LGKYWFQLKTSLKSRTGSVGPHGGSFSRGIKETPKVTGFVGGGVRPVPLTSEEADSLLKQVDSGTAAPREQIRFVKGDNIRIIDGPFLGFNALVDEVDADHNRVKVLVSIFGRSTPVELGFMQVERI
jgi:transcription termination/antitermination protein NusG